MRCQPNWGDMRNCLNQLITEPSVASAMFEYRFGGNGELSGRNLGNLMLKALDHLSVRPLEAINLIRNLLKVDTHLIPMSEHPVDLMAIDDQGQPSVLPSRFSRPLSAARKKFIPCNGPSLTR